MNSCRPSLSSPVAVVAAFLGMGAPVADAAQQPPALIARAARLAEAVPAGQLDNYRVVVKFKDALRMRAVDGRAVGAVAAAVAIDPRIRFEQLIRMPQDRLDFLEARAFANSLRAQPDLASMMELVGPAELMPLAFASLKASPLVEWVEYELLTPPPPFFGGCADFAPATPNYVGLQGYRGPNPGLNMDALWLLGNARGAGIKVADCEYWFDPDHEDLCGVIPEPGQTPRPEVVTNGWHDHGTAVLGEMVGASNGYGVTGLVPDATAYFFPEWTVEGGARRATAIAQAVATVGAGDVVLLEMQTSITGGTNYGPAELNQSVWTIVKNASDAGVIVVGAAGNGNQDLDGSAYSAYRARGDSGAIIVGAGSASTQHSKLSFSTFGSRVNVQGWGTSVFTLGYGTHAQLGGDPRQKYTAGFNGTSSASPFIAASCVALQGYAVANIGRRLTPAEMRTILASTGWPQQGTGGSIGPFPNLVAAAQAVLDLAPSADIDGDGVVDAEDLAALLVQWGTCASCSADLTGDGQVGGADLAVLLAAWGS